ncbi:hypothetical protein [Endozoicomonas sp. SCSIO W0465]|uniref:hypothetical protein n=1 Tax=Endozoicomonas sp. SCSIO W0465 TaxID=2918516 RepID=UPI0020750FA5|nr:hypothetical protein [Endozoicomonas sp. SCSIO W0465]USE38394.1 hypothetical protein MJO57_09620 [Endozoicomonas sp. SCSIO W0465]
MTTKQKVHIDRTPQFDIFAPITQSEVESEPVKPSHSSQRCFISPDAETIYLGNTSLKNYLWVSGGIFPDHANIGRFINRHAEQLTGSFFESIVKTVLRRTHSKGDRLAGDGTLVHAACSHYHLIREEAVKTALEEAQQQLEKKPEDPIKKADVEKKTDVFNKLQERQALRKRAGSKPEDFRICPVESEAVVQKMKRGRGHAASYKPSSKPMHNQ